MPRSQRCRPLCTNKGPTREDELRTAAQRIEDLRQSRPPVRENVTAPARSHVHVIGATCANALGSWRSRPMGERAPSGIAMELRDRARMQDAWTAFWRDPASELQCIRRAPDIAQAL